MEKNCEYIGQVLSLGSEGEGVIKCGDTTAFVPFCLVGERVSFKALKVGGGIAYGKLTEVNEVSPHRQIPKCPHFEKCGGCQLQHADYDTQLQFKRQTVQNCLKKIGNISAEVSPTVASDKQYGYRNKLALPVGVDEEGNCIVGFYAPRSHRIVPIDDCPLQADWFAPLVSALKEFANELGVAGNLRQLVARQNCGKSVITVVADRMINLDGFAQRLDKRFKDYTLWLNVNNSTGNAVFGKEWHICRGEGYFMGEDCGVKFKAGANTFLQINDGVRTKLYEAVTAAVANKNAVAVDLYSGGGMLTAMLAKNCAAAYGIEIVPEAVACADELAKLNGLQDKMFNYCGAVEDKIGEVFKKTAGYDRVIVCDPPRKGMERSVVKAIQSCGAEKVVLVSCNPATLARDLGLLCGSLKEVDGQLVKNPDYAQDGQTAQNGYYNIVSVTPFDMFPQTKHVETLVLLSHKKPDGHINVTVEFGEEEGQVSLKEVSKRAEARKPKEKVTYKVIQDYIEENYGFKVHTAYIAEVKRDLGLPMYDAPNAVEELKRPRAHPTPKMVEVIKQTLKHFEIV